MYKNTRLNVYKNVFRCTQPCVHLWLRYSLPIAAEAPPTPASLPPPHWSKEGKGKELFPPSSLSNGEDPSEMPQEKKGETGKSKTRKVAEDGIFLLFLSSNKQKQTGKKREIKVRPSSPSSAPPPSRTPSVSEPRRTARNRSWRNSNYAHGKHTCGINCFFFTLPVFRMRP